MKKPKSPWQTLGTKIIFQNPWMTLRQDDVVTPTGKPGTYTIFEANPFVIIAAIENNKLVMIGQHRYPLDQMFTEFPAGGIESGEQPLAAAQRELREETGYEASSWEYVGKFYELVSVSRQQGHLFIASDLHDTSTNKMKEDGISRRISLGIDELERMINEGEIVDALTPAVLYKVKLRLAAKSKRDRRKRHQL